jgi:hypothetical protein
LAFSNVKRAHAHKHNQGRTVINFKDRQLEIDQPKNALNWNDMVRLQKLKAELDLDCGMSKKQRNSGDVNGDPFSFQEINDSVEVPAILINNGVGKGRGRFM